MHTTEVQHIAKPEGVKRENPPHLHDFREFVDACDGLPDDMAVTISVGGSDKTGRKDVVFAAERRSTRSCTRRTTASSTSPGCGGSVRGFTFGSSDERDREVPDP